MCRAEWCILDVCRSACGQAKEFTFDRAFPPGCTQDEVYNEVGGPIVDAVMKGYNGTVLAYGQTVSSTAR